MSSDDGAGVAAGDGVWAAAFTDGSGAHVFPSEVEALRWAHRRSAVVWFVRWGDSVLPAEGEAPETVWEQAGEQRPSAGESPALS